MDIFIDTAILKSISWMVCWK